MKVTISWLKDFVDFDLLPSELSDCLNLAGLEVGGISVIGNWGANVVVGRVISLRPHPNAERLRLASVDTSEGELFEVVCGAPNLAIGQNIAFAKTGALLFNPNSGKQDFQLKPSKIRGVISAGMICSEYELGLGDDHDGTLVLENNLNLGMSLQDIFGETVLDLEPSPNRPDWLGVVGVAREISAITGSPLKLPDISYSEESTTVEQLANVTIADPDLCLRYMGGVIQDVTIKPAPSWMQRRLKAIGERPINNVVDTTNYVMFETGQPLHAFDYDKLHNGNIVVRRAKIDEQLATLDGKQRKFQANDLLITDGKQPVAIGAIMGGANSQIEDNTTNLLLEVANFDGPNTRRMSREFKLRTEASLRFEKSIHPANAEFGMRRGMRLLRELTGGKAAAGLLDVYPQKQQNRTVELTQKRIKYVLGVSWNDTQVEKTLTSLGFEHKQSATGEWRVAVPYWRIDVSIAEDLCEELSRIIGYDTIKSAPIASPLPQVITELNNNIKTSAIGACVQFGLQEVITYATTAHEVDALCNRDSANSALDLVNPVSLEHAVLRRSLRANLLKVAAHNLNTARSGVAIFECGRLYGVSSSKSVIEHDSIAGVLAGSRSNLHWRDTSAKYDFYDAKGCVETILARLGIKTIFEPVQNELFSKGRAILIRSTNSDILGVAGEVSRTILDYFDIDARVLALFELNLQKLHGVSGADYVTDTRYEAIVRLPEVIRDLSLVIDNDVPAENLIDIIKQHTLVKSVTVFDLYQGDDLPQNKKAIALRVIYQSPEKTLSSGKVASIENNTLKKLHSKFGATLRSDIKD